MSKKKYVIDFTRVKHFLEVHLIIKEALDFPDYYGCNWSAFWDCLSDMYGEPMHIEIIGLDVVREKFNDYEEKMLSILRKFKHFNNDLFAKDITIEVVGKDGRTEID